jgi:hypothetical protein
MLVGCTGRSSSAADATPELDAEDDQLEFELIYTDLNHSGGMGCALGKQWFDADDPDASMADSKDQNLEFSECFNRESGATQWGDCSTTDFVCASDESDLYAVPRKPLSLGLVYFVHGVEFEVVDCGWYADCSEATILKDCTHANESLCGKYFDSGIFLYDKDEGVVAFGGQDSTPCLFGDQRFMGKLFWNGILAADYGLLTPHLTLPPLGLGEDTHSANARLIEQRPLRERFLEKVEIAQQATEMCEEDPNEYKCKSKADCPRL